jgi:hypothetical protein
MKLSNKILIGFFGFIFVYLIAAFTEIRFRGNLNQLDEATGIVETVDISGITYLVVQDLDESVTLVGSEEPRIEVRSISGDLLKNLEYSLRGDTLELVQLELADDEHLNLIVYVPKNSFRGMAVNGATVVVEGLDQKQLTISQNAGRIRLTTDNKLEKLSVQASENGDLNFAGAKLDTLSILLNNSKVAIQSGAARVEGSMANGSYLWINDVDDIDFKKDGTCRLYLN